MKSRSSRLVAAGIAVSLAFGGILPAGAAPFFAGRHPATSSNIVKVQGGGGDMGGNFQRNDAQKRNPPAYGGPERDAPRAERRPDRGPDRGLDRGADRRDARERFERRGNTAYYNGHRGYRERRDGYEEKNGFWFPAAAFLAGALLGGAVISNQNQAVAAPPPGGNPHVDWCASQYRSYNPYDNSFQPYNGPRRACRSPYG